MCGLVGVIHKGQEPFELGLLDRMAATLHHRGPDESGRFVQGPVAFCHKRLSIIDLNSGGQPMTSDTATIVFNGEIYNYLELRDELIQLGHRFRTKSDTEVILRMYLQYGPSFVSKLNGMFAFLIYDQAQGLVLVARDHLGVKPLYFYHGGDKLMFASEIKALLAHPEVAPEPDYGAMHEYLIFQFVLGDKTLFKNIYKLPPGHYQVIDIAKGDIRTVRYWEPRFIVDFDHTEKYFVEELRRLIEESVRIQMRSDVPVGTHLSGGMDSSLVTMLAARFSTGSLKTFTGAFAEGPEFDESSYAREVAESCHGQSFVVRPTDHEFVDLLPRLVWHMDEPAAGPGLFPQYVVSRLARKEVKVVLGGQGGDEIFGGYTRYVIAYLEQALKGAIFETNEEGTHFVSLQSLAPNLPMLNRFVPALREFWREGAFEPMDRRYFRLIDRSGGNVHMFTKDFARTCDLTAAFERFQSVFNHPETQSYFNKMTYFDMVASLPALLQVEDRVSMAVSLESRVPLLDHRIADLIASMPPALKFKGAEMKYILKKAVKDLVPRKILERKDKMGFPVPLHIWARGRARDFFRSILLSRACRSRGLFDSSAVEELFDREEAFGRRLWGLLNLELWFQQFIDHRPNLEEGTYASHVGEWRD